MPSVAARVFVDPDVEFLRSILPPATDPEFFKFLRGLDCSDVTLRSVPEGTAVFARVSLKVTVSSIGSVGRQRG